MRSPGAILEAICQSSLWPPVIHDPPPHAKDTLVIFTRGSFNFFSGIFIIAD